MHRKLNGLIVAALAWFGVAYAQEENDEIVVTASRYQEAYQSFAVPHVSRVMRADFAVQNVTITSDTRDAAARRLELRQALQSLTRFANREARISVALIREDQDESGEARVIVFNVEDALESLRPAGRPDTSQVTVAVRTRVQAGDALDDVENRIAEFVRAIPRPGRVEVLIGAMQLSLTDPRQYRRQLVADIAADATAISSALGDGYGARIEGLESPIAWRRAGDLDLRLFVPYRMVVLPRAAQ